MEVLQPESWREALEAKAAEPDAKPLAGGTDVMVEINFDRLRPTAILDLTRVPELAEWAPVDGRLRIGAGVTYARLIAELGDRLPGLAIASRTVGSPQIRNRGTVGGNLGTSSPAGDALPPLFAAGAEVELESLERGTRVLGVAEFVSGPKRNALAPDELISAFLIRPADGPQQFAKIGTRNAMVIAVCSLSLHLSAQRRVTACIGSAGPTPIRPRDAEAFIDGVIAEGSLPERAAARFGDLVARAAQPIDDVRGTAAYRRRALAVLARRTLTWAWEEACA